jgi:hypothetical protein
LLETSTIQVKSQHRISRQWSSSFLFGFCNKNNTEDSMKECLPVNIEAEAEFKYKVSPCNNHVNLYLGIRHSMDGWKWVFGFKIVGVKVKLPTHIVMPKNSVTTDAF